MIKACPRHCALRSGVCLPACMPASKPYGHVFFSYKLPKKSMKSCAQAPAVHVLRTCASKWSWSALTPAMEDILPAAPISGNDW